MIILMKLSTLTALEVVISNALIDEDFDENFVNM